MAALTLTTPNQASPPKQVLHQDIFPHRALTKFLLASLLLEVVTLTTTFIPFISNCAFIDQKGKELQELLAMKKAR